MAEEKCWKVHHSLPLIWVQFQYEERINALESQLQSQAGHNHLKEGDHPHTHAVALQRELDVVRERHRKKVAELELSCEGLRKEVAALKNKEGGEFVNAFVALAQI